MTLMVLVSEGGSSTTRVEILQFLPFVSHHRPKLSNFRNFASSLLKHSRDRLMNNLSLDPSLRIVGVLFGDLMFFSKFLNLFHHGDILPPIRVNLNGFKAFGVFS